MLAIFQPIFVMGKENPLQVKILADIKPEDKKDTIKSKYPRVKRPQGQNTRYN